MKRCGEASPWETVCTLPEGEHYDHADAANKIWPNPALTRPHNARDAKITASAKARQIASGTRPVTTAHYQPVRPVSSFTEPLAGTAKARVLSLLRTQADWVDGWSLTRHDVGGMNATRRLRELREDGYLIEDRRKPGDPHAFQYRLLEG